MKVNDLYKRKYAENARHYLEVAIGGHVYSNEDILEESLELRESLTDAESLDFIGCVSNEFKITLTNPKENLRGEDIHVFVYAEDKNEPGSTSVPLFHGTVESATLADNKRAVTITAYDNLYYVKDFDIADFWNELFPEMETEIELNYVLRRVFDYVISQTQVYLSVKAYALPNGNYKILGGYYKPEEFKFIEFLRGICQLNGVFGIVNRESEFEFRTLVQPEITDDGAYPGADLILPFFPGIGYIDEDDANVYYPYYRSVNYSDYKMHKFNKVSIRQTDTARAVSAGAGAYRLIIQGNPFTAYMNSDAAKARKQEAAARILDNIKGIDYIPYTAQNEGLPWVEVGKNWASYYVYDYEKSRDTGVDSYKTILVPIISRVMRGIQAPVDTFEALGVMGKKTTITDLGISEAVDGAAVAKNTEDISKNTAEINKTNNTVSGIDGRVQSLEQSAWNVQSVQSLPENPDPRTIYLIQGSVG